MKHLLAFSLLFSLSAVAQSNELKLDAACKITCKIMISEISNDQGLPYLGSNEEIIYSNEINVTREENESRIKNGKFDKLCKKQLSPEAFQSQFDCIYVKH